MLTPANIDGVNDNTPCFYPTPAPRFPSALRNWSLIRKTILPMTYCVVFAGLLRLLFSYARFPNAF